MKTGERESSSIPSSSPSSSSSANPPLTTHKEHKGAPVIVPLIKPSAGTDQDTDAVHVWKVKSGCWTCPSNPEARWNWYFLLFTLLPEIYGVGVMALIIIKSVNSSHANEILNYPHNWCPLLVYLNQYVCNLKIIDRLFTECLWWGEKKGNKNQGEVTIL